MNCLRQYIFFFSIRRRDGLKNKIVRCLEKQNAVKAKFIVKVVYTVKMTLALLMITFMLYNIGI